MFALYISKNLVSDILVKAFDLEINKYQLNTNFKQTVMMDGVRGLGMMHNMLCPNFPPTDYLRVKTRVEEKVHWAAE